MEKNFFGKIFFGDFAKTAKSVRNRVSCDSWRPSWGENVLRGLSNKCLMRGTFPAILVFMRFYPLACLKVKTAKIQKRCFPIRVGKRCFSRFSRTPRFGRYKLRVFAVFVKIDKIVFFHDFHFHEIQNFHENLKIYFKFYKIFYFIKIKS